MYKKNKHIQLTKHVHYCINNIYPVYYAAQWNVIIFNKLCNMTVWLCVVFRDSVVLFCLQKNAVESLERAHNVIWTKKGVEIGERQDRSIKYIH